MRSLVLSVKKIAERLYSDFILPNRLQEWQLLLQTALDYGYEIHSVASFWEFLNKKELNDGKYLIIRHDIDTDTFTARKMWETEKQLEITCSSYYFRLSTIDIPLMQDIDKHGGEVSYHYEELATYAKHKSFTNKEELLDHLDTIRGIFKKNLESLRMQTGIPMRIVASHGDWMNRKLGITNCVILDDKEFRKDLGIELETYDAEFMDFVTSRLADAPYPTFWKPDNPINAIYRNKKVIYILVHPRQWRANIIVNFIDNLYRVWEGIIFFFKTRWKN